MRLLFLSEISDSRTPTEVSLDRDVDLEEHGRYLHSDQLLYRRHAALTRRKRNILFPSGVKLCTQETFDQAIANHLSYFHLRGVFPSAPFSVADVQKLIFLLILEVFH